MTDCNRKEFATINKPARSKCQSKCSNTVASHYSNSQFFSPCDLSPRTVVVPKKNTAALPHMSLFFQWGLIRTWSIIMRRPVFVTLTGSINLALQRWCFLQCYICSRSFATSALQQYMTEYVMKEWRVDPRLALGTHRDRRNTLPHIVSGQVHLLRHIYTHTNKLLQILVAHTAIHYTMKTVLPLLSWKG